MAFLLPYNGVFKHDLTIEEFEAELRAILLPAVEEKVSFKDRLLGGWKYEKKISLYIISSLFFACVLFIYATSTNFQNSNTARQVKSETYTNTITKRSYRYSL